MSERRGVDPPAARPAAARPEARASGEHPSRARAERRAREEMWQMRRRGRMRRRGPFGRGFGCAAALLFLLVASSVFFAVGSHLARIGPAPAVITVLAAFAVVALAAHGLRSVARSLDRMVDATGRVEVGDYSVRVGRPESRLPAVHALAAGFDTMVERLEVDERQRRTLLADVSHELRTPLAIISGNLEAIIDGVYPADDAHLVPVLEETRVMERLVEDLRTIALTDAGTLALHPEPTDPDVLLAEVVGAFRAAADAAGIDLRTDVPEDLPIVELDPIRIREVLANLVGNAIRHTPRGGSVVVRGAATAEAVTVEVSDTGPGIDPALLPHVFDRFVKGATSRGSGLGLAIVRALVEAHAGTISVASEPDRGTTFSVRLPRT